MRPLLILLLLVTSGRAHAQEATSPRPFHSEPVSSASLPDLVADLDRALNVPPYHPRVSRDGNVLLVESTVCSWTIPVRSTSSVSPSELSGGRLGLELRTEGIQNLCRNTRRPSVAITFGFNDEVERDEAIRALRALIAAWPESVAEPAPDRLPGDSPAPPARLTEPDRPITLLSSTGEHTERGRLATDDEALPSGHRIDRYTVEVGAGNDLTVDLRSPDFDTYLVLSPPSGDNLTNDDWDRSLSHSRIEVEGAAAGTWEIGVRGYLASAEGDYEITIERSEASGPTPPASLASRSDLVAAFERAMRKSVHVMHSRTVRGYRVTEHGDGIRIEGLPDSGSCVTTIAITETLYARVEQPGRNGEDRFAFRGPGILLEDAPGRDCIVAGTWLHDLYNFPTPGDRDAALAAARDLIRGWNGPPGPERSFGARAERDRLMEGDETLGDGRYFDRYPVEVVAGDRLVVDLRSTDFDPYLDLYPPASGEYSNDDWNGSRSHSRIEVDVTVSGIWEIRVRGYAQGATGAYDLTIQTADNP
ncbi:MAG: PPC domain-containing protein [Bacteroidota bacterium]